MCPYCNSTSDFYTKKNYVYDAIVPYKNFDGLKAENNSQLCNSLLYKCYL